ncbi:FAD/NAD(P)-binding protein [Saccharothrix stipae]
MLRDHTDSQASEPLHPDQPPPADTGLIPLTIPEIKHLIAEATATPRPPGHTTHWVNWRRTHQARSRWFHKRTGLARTIEITRVSYVANGGGSIPWRLPYLGAPHRGGESRTSEGPDRCPVVPRVSPVRQTPRTADSQRIRGCPGETAAVLDATICVIGLGPGGLSVVERVCADAIADGTRVRVHVVDPHLHAGGVWPTGQPGVLMNTVASQVRADLRLVADLITQLRLDQRPHPHCEPVRPEPVRSVEPEEPCE